MPRHSVHNLDGFSIQIDCEPTAYFSTEEEMTLVFVSDVTDAEGNPLEAYKVTLSGDVREQIGAFIAADQTYPAIAKLGDELAQAQEMREGITAAVLEEEADEASRASSDAAQAVADAAPTCRKCGAAEGEPCGELGSRAIADVSEVRQHRLASQGCVVAVAYLNAQ